MGVIGKHCGIAQIGRWKLSGVGTWFLWRAVYFMKLPGLRSRVRVAMDWMLDLLFPRDITKVEVHRTDVLQRAHFAQGEVIIRQGDVADVVAAVLDRGDRKNPLLVESDGVDHVPNCDADRETGSGLDELTGDLERFPQRLVNIRVRAKQPFEEIPEVREAIRAAEQAFGESGRILVRFSGTELLARVMVEGADPRMVDQHAEGIAAEIEKAIGAKPESG